MSFSSSLGGVAAGVAGDLAGVALSGRYNAKEAKKNREFQAYMSNTAYQRAAVDLENAGLNRVLALGSPSSSPSGATASIQAPKLGSTGIAAATAKQSIAQSRATEAAQIADAQLKREQTRLTAANASQAEVVKSLYDKYGPDLIGALPDSGSFMSSVKDAVGSPAKAIKDAVRFKDSSSAADAKQSRTESVTENRERTKSEMSKMSSSEKVQYIWNTLLEKFL